MWRRVGRWVRSGLRGVFYLLAAMVVVGFFGLYAWAIRDGYRDGAAVAGGGQAVHASRHRALKRTVYGWSFEFGRWWEKK
jgi:hypothetical protein